MQWDAALPGAGFTNGRSWLPISTDTSVRAQDGDPSSMLSLYRRLLELRRSNAALVQGAIENVAASGDMLTFERHYRGQRLFIALNMGAADAVMQPRSGVVLLSTLAGREGQALPESGYRLAGSEAIIAAI